MRNATAALLSVTAIVFPVSSAVAATETATKATTKKAVTRKVAGTSVEAGRWGTVKVVLTVKTTGSGAKKTVKFSDLGGNYSYHTDRSQYIMSQSLPVLRQEFLSAQSANIQLVSGATDTSQAFERSLQAALLKVKSVTV
jgi:uncharacterized protein with FMN-binding domain